MHNSLAKIQNLIHNYSCNQQLFYFLVQFTRNNSFITHLPNYEFFILHYALYIMNYEL